MADIFVNIGGSYKELDKAYVNINGVWKEVEGVWCNIDGVWKEVGLNKLLAYYGLVSLTYYEELRRGTFGASVGDYALFAGGEYRLYYDDENFLYTSTNVVDAFNSSLVKSSAPNLGSGGGYGCGTSVGDYAIFHSRAISSSYNIYAYSTNLTKQALSGLSGSIGYTSAIGSRLSHYNYALIVGGYTSNPISQVTAINKSLVRTSPAELTVPTREPGVATVGGNYLINLADNTVDAYNSSLVRTNIGSLGDARTGPIGASLVDNYALFVGGSVNYYTGSNYVDIFNSSLVRSSTTAPYAIKTMNSSYLEGNLLLCTDGLAKDFVYTNSLVRYNVSYPSTLPSYSLTSGGGVETVGNYIIADTGGGRDKSTRVYTLV